MKRIEVDFLNPALSPKECAITLGCFDGIHLGHQEIIFQLKKMAQKKGIKTALYVFHPHPQIVLNSQSNFKKLFTLQEIETLLQPFELDFFGLIPFNLNISRWSPEEFITSFLVPHFNPRLWITGYDFAFGAGREGQFSHLKSFAKILNFEVQQVPPVINDEEPVSTSRIKKLLISGYVEKVNKLLGKEFFFSGTVIKGEGRGQSLGYPTANLLPEGGKVMPKRGVYSVQVHFQNKWHPGVMNIGLRPTFRQKSKKKIINKKQLHFEVHIINKSFHLYDKQLCVKLKNFLREERVFNGEKDLKLQIQKDIQKTLKHFPPPDR